MSQFDKQHLEAFGQPAPKGGYPDSGNGFYANKLSYAHWYELNNWQRAQMNLLETIVPVSVMIGITAINQPFIACICAGVFFVGRVLYAFGYCCGGPKGRLPGAIITDLALLGALGGAFYSIFTWESSDSLTDANAPYKIFPISQ